MPDSQTFEEVFENMIPYGIWELEIIDINENDITGDLNHFQIDIETSRYPEPGCGNGLLEDDETCDDGVNDNRGCASDCKGPAPGYVCFQGSAYDQSTCVRNTGVDQETLLTYRIDQVCDDGNEIDHDGCDKFHKREVGATCIRRRNLADICYTNLCGNGRIDSVLE